MRDRLIELIKQAEHIHMQMVLYSTVDELIDLPNKEKTIADHLLANGVIVPPCNVGDTVWEVNTDSPFDEDLRVMESKVERFMMFTSVDIHSLDCIGKTVFLTREEAERALRKEDEGK